MSVAKRQKLDEAAFRIPYDLLVSFANAGGPQLAVSLATTCKHVKRRLDERYEVNQQVSLDAFLDPERDYQRRFGALGKYVNVYARWPSQADHIPGHTQSLYLENDGDYVFLNLSEYHLPQKLKRLKFGNVFSSFPAKKLILPTGLEEFTVGYIDPEVKHLQLPENLRLLRFLNVREIQSKHGLILPVGLETLILPGCYQLEFDLPSNLKTLHLGDSLVHGLKLPPNLEVLHFGYQFNHSVSELNLPQTLRELHFIGIDQPIHELKLPPHLEKLMLGWAFDNSLKGLQIPKSLKVIEVKGNHEWLQEHGFSLDPLIPCEHCKKNVACQCKRVYCR